MAKLTGGFGTASMDIASPWGQPMPKFIIKDWANNICFHGKTFESFEEAWGFIYEKDPIPEPAEENEAHWYDDYFVEKI